MVQLIRRRTNKRRKRKTTRPVDQRTNALELAGLELLAHADYEQISINQIVNHAGCSIGAFYYRNPDKNAYLLRLIARTFKRLERDLERQLSEESSIAARGKIKLSDFIEYIIIKLSHKEIAGIIRAALKLGTTDAKALEYYTAYRAQVAESAEYLYKGSSKKGPSSCQIHEALQMLFATLNDAIQCPNSAAMKLGNSRMVRALTHMVVRTISVKSEFTALTTKPSLPNKRENKNQPTKRQPKLRAI
jgi:AcrR family transcriptional regulator